MASRAAISKNNPGALGGELSRRSEPSVRFVSSAQIRVPTTRTVLAARRPGCIRSYLAARRCALSSRVYSGASYPSENSGYSSLSRST